MRVVLSWPMPRWLVTIGWPQRRRPSVALFGLLIMVLVVFRGIGMDPMAVVGLLTVAGLMTIVGSLVIEVLAQLTGRQAGPGRTGVVG